MSSTTSSSSSRSASRSRAEFGIVMSGLPPVTKSARTCRGPGVRISSARTPPGNASFTDAEVADARAVGPEQRAVLLAEAREVDDAAPDERAAARGRGCRRRR